MKRAKLWQVDEEAAFCRFFIVASDTRPSTAVGDFGKQHDDQRSRQPRRLRARTRGDPEVVHRLRRDLIERIVGRTVSLGKRRLPCGMLS